MCTWPSPASHSPEVAAGSTHTGLEYATGRSPRLARRKYQRSSADVGRTVRSAPPAPVATTSPPLVTTSRRSAGSLAVPRSPARAGRALQPRAHRRAVDRERRASARSRRPRPRRSGARAAPRGSRRACSRWRAAPSSACAARPSRPPAACGGRGPRRRPPRRASRGRARTRRRRPRPRARRRSANSSRSLKTSMPTIRPSASGT